ncbi:hypothetical protein ACJMK2_040567 [Sinanodonta woodiana]|uniref:Uncharacterized protein n=1 Tax=Sinanodonta woodiana TaxID=1069815 RepID=A0ABD3W526_SINWO
MTPCKTPRKLEINFINHNPFDALNDEETQKENELLKEMEATEPRGTSTPKSKARAAKKEESNKSLVLSEKKQEGKTKKKEKNGPNLAMQHWKQRNEITGKRKKALRGRKKQIHKRTPLAL